MEAVTGIFRSLADGRRAAERLEPLIGPEHVNLLTPESTRAEVKTVPTTEDMPPVGAPMGATIGGAVGVAAAVMIPGLGQVTALGVAAAALFAAAGAALGWKVGGAADRALSGGLPVDDLYFYEDALRQGRTVLVALVDDPEQAPQVREILTAHGAEDIDAARDRWWMGLRDAESEHYGFQEGDEEAHERLYRYGFTIGATGSPRRPQDLELWPHLDEHERSIVTRGYERGVQVRRTTQREEESARGAQ
jgi:hypothetical protein